MVHSATVDPCSHSRARFARHALTPRAGVPEGVANPAAFLASDLAGFITGVTIQVDGGLTAHFPNYADELAAAAVTAQ
jgi:NAD(P)-dependent dehydrogenase (short-subunit alcohol dehydrogenase family)